MTRTSATSSPAAWDGDAISTKWIYGDGRFEFKAGTSNKRFMIGFAEVNPDRTWTSLLFAFYLKNDATWDIRESGAVATGSPTGGYVVGDKFCIERLGTTVKYYVNDVLKRTSTVQSQGILFVDTSFFDGSGSINGCLHSGAGGPEDVLWINNVGTVGAYPTGGQGSQLSKNVATSFSDSDAVSSKAIVGDGALTFRFGQTNMSLTMGLATANSDRNLVSLNYAIFASGSNFSIIENGVLENSARSYTITDVFSIRRNGSQITYLKNGVVVYTSTVASTGNLFADCSIYTNGALFTNCQIEGYPLAESAMCIGTWITATNSSTGFEMTSTAAGGGAVTFGMIPGDGGHSFPNNGSLSFRFSQSSVKSAEAGLTTSRTSSPTAATINFGVKGRSDGLLEIIEAGTSLGTFGSYSTTDLFEVRRLNGQIEYLKNGTLLRSVTAPLGPLSGAFTFTEVSGAIKDILFYNGQSDLLWRKQVHSTPSWSANFNGGLTRDGSTAGWTADALGTRQLVGDGYLQWTFSNTGKDAMVGLSPSDKNNSYTDLQYAIYANGSTAGAPLKIYENGTNTGTFGTFTTTDTFRIRRAGSTIYYSRIDSAGTETVLKTSTITFSGPLVADCSLQDLSVAITNCRISYGDSDGDGMDDLWELAEFGDLTQTSTGDIDSDGSNNLHEFYNGTVPNNHAPTVSLAVQKIVPEAQATLKLVAVPSDIDGNLLRVDFYENSSLVGTVNSAPWEFTLSGRAAGNYTYQATAVDGENLTGSATQAVTVNNPVVSKISGDDQKAPDNTFWPANAFLPGQLVVDVRDGTGGAVLANRQVTFTVTQGTGGLSATSGGTTSTTLNVTSDNLGQAAVWFRQPLQGDFQSQISAVVAPGSPVTFTETTNALVGHWKLDESSGATAADASGALNPGTVDPTTSWGKGYNWTTGPATGGLAIQGASYTGQADLLVQNTGNRVLPATGQPFSFTMWFRGNAIAAGNVYGLLCNETYQQTGLRVAIDNGVFGPGQPVNVIAWSSESGGTVGLRSTTVIAPLRWYHLAITYSGTTAKMYIDGALVGTSTGTILSNTNDIRFGGGIGGYRNLDGRLDDVRVYHKELSAAEIAGIRDSLTDGDTLPDAWERQYFGDLHWGPNDDPDHDGVTNAAEYAAGTSPAGFSDEDSDGMSDAWEYAHFGNLNATASGNNDSDALNNLEEFLFGTDPLNAAVTDTTGQFVKLEIFTKLE